MARKVAALPLYYLPLLASTIFFLVVVDMLASFQTFTPIAL